jgi:hypothetical protein
MVTPPPVSGDSYPAMGTLAERSNYLRYGVTLTTAYSDNVLGGASTNPVSDVSYSIWPTIAFDQTTPRLHSVVTYSPGFTFYQRISGRNEADQNATLNLRYRLSPHVTISLRDSFQKSSSIFNQPDIVSSPPISGAAQPPTVAIIAPIADLLTNTTNGGINYQFGPKSMIGAGGSVANLRYPHLAEVPGLYDSRSYGGSAFYNYHLSRKHYIGATYQCSKMLAYGAGEMSSAQTHSVFGFYTVYFKPTLSLSLSGGPQYSDIAQAPLPASRSWSPAATANMGWQGRVTSLAANYSRLITGGGGLLGAYHSNSANGSASWQLARTWNLGASGTYAIYKTLTPFYFLSSPGGHSVSGSVSIRHQMTEHLNVEAGYTRWHQSYNGIALVSAFPNTNREYVSVSYQFSRPLGR